MNVALATAAEAVDLDEDLAPLRGALEAIGVDVATPCWDDETVGWSEFDLVVVRSTWDYVTRLDEFLAWTGAVAAVTALHNPPAVLRWNTDKHYLPDLAAAGLPIVPTTLLAPGDSPDVVAAAIGAFTGDYVVKPTVSAGSKDTARYAARDDDGRALAHAGALLDAGRSVIIQPYLDAIDEYGETAVVYVDGEFSHGLRKGPILQRGDPLVDGLYAIEHMSAREPSAAERTLADAVVAAVPGITGVEHPLLYGRVDMVLDEHGEPVVLELELTEPSLFHDYAPGSADRFAAAIAGRAAAR